MSNAEWDNADERADDEAFRYGFTADGRFKNHTPAQFRLVCDYGLQLVPWLVPASEAGQIMFKMVGEAMAALSKDIYEAGLRKRSSKTALQDDEDGNIFHRASTIHVPVDVMKLLYKIAALCGLVRTASGPKMKKSSWTGAPESFKLLLGITTNLQVLYNPFLRANYFTESSVKAAAAHLSGKTHIGRTVQKEFNGVLFKGTVISARAVTVGEEEGVRTYYRVSYSDGDSEDLEILELEQVLVDDGKRRRIDLGDNAYAFNPLDAAVQEGRVRQAMDSYALEYNPDPSMYWANRHALIMRHACPSSSDGLERDSEAFVKSVFFMHFAEEHPTTITFEEIWDPRSNMPLGAKVTLAYTVAGRERSVLGGKMKVIGPGLL